MGMESLTLTMDDLQNLIRDQAVKNYGQQLLLNKMQFKIDALEAEVVALKNENSELRAKSTPSNGDGCGLTNRIEGLNAPVG